jgi:hypothetical protein
MTWIHFALVGLILAGCVFMYAGLLRSSFVTVWIAFVTIWASTLGLLVAFIVTSAAWLLLAPLLALVAAGVTLLKCAQLSGKAQLAADDELVQVEASLSRWRSRLFRALVAAFIACLIPLGGLYFQLFAG